MEIYFVLAIMLFMVVGFVLHKWPFGVTTMICCALLVVTGVFKTPQAFAGFSNKNIVLVAPIFALSAAFGKTTVLKKIQDSLNILQDKNGFMLVLGLYLIAVLIAQFLPTTPAITLMLMFLVSLKDTGDVTPSRMTIPILAMVSVCGLKLPIGSGAAQYVRFNALYEGMTSSPDQLIRLTDLFKVSIIPMVLVIVYSLFAYKLMPNTKYDSSKLKAKNPPKKEEAPALDKRSEIITYIVFAVVMCSLFMESVLGEIMYVMPAIGVLVLILTNSMSIKDVISSMCQDATWMLAGTVVMADALGATGAGNLIGNIILKILGGTPSSLFVLFVFAIVTIVMTTFMSNSATLNVLIPVAASTCLAAGWDPRGAVLIVAFCSNAAIAFPSGSPACGIAYAAGGYKISSTMKYTLPLIAIAVVSIVFACEFFFPCI